MDNSEDPFAILGISREASSREIRLAYRRLAMHWHPDRNSAPAAETEFKRLQSAYETLLDPQRAAAWRQAAPSEKAATPAGGKQSGPDLTHALILTLEEAAYGCLKNIELPHTVACAHCQGKGKVPHRHSIPCAVCNGCGRVSLADGRPGLCGGCAGRGYLRESACPHCAASGWRQELHTLAVSVPPGLLDGERLRLAGQAPLPPGRASLAGDLYLEIRLAPHALFVRQGRNLQCVVPVSIFRLLRGGFVDVPTLAGATRLDLPPPPGLKFDYRLAGLGLPGKHGAKAGDLLVRLESVFPLDFDADDLVLLDRLERSLSADRERRAPQLAAWEKQMRARRPLDG